MRCQYVAKSSHVWLIRQLVSRLLATFIPEADSSGWHNVNRLPADVGMTFACDADIKPNG
jgi:hypothetical protein